MSEHHEQVAFVQWCQLHETQHPELKTLYAIPNGGLRPFKIDKNGRRFSVEAKKLRDSGAKAGVPDLHLPVARQGYHSLYIEMKFKRNGLSPNQKTVVALLQAQGNKVVVCWSCEAAIKEIGEYLSAKPY